MIENWIVRKRPMLLERRIEFADYEETRAFLERIAELSEREDYYPDMSFGRTHVHVTIRPEGDEDEFSETLIKFARAFEALVPAPTN